MDTRSDENGKDTADSAGKAVASENPAEAPAAGDSGMTAADAGPQPPRRAGAAEEGKPPAGTETSAHDVDESISSVIDELEKGKVAPETVLEEFRSADARLSAAGRRPEGDNIGLLMDIQISVRVELGRTRKSVEEIMSLTPGMVIELDRKAGDNVDLYLNDKLFAEGEVTVVDGNFAVRVMKLIGRI